MKCEICRESIATQYLEKPLGTVVKDAKGKQHWVCSQCQARFHNKKDVLLKQMG